MSKMRLEPEKFDQLLRDARAGSEEALGIILETSRLYLFKLSRRYLPSEVRRRYSDSDLVQDAMVEAFQHFMLFRGSNQPELLAWLKTILMTLASGQKRRHVDTAKRDVRREVPINVGGVTTPATATTPLDLLLEEEEEELFLRAFEQLSPAEQTFLRLRCFLRLSFEEMGRQLNCSEPTARRVTRRAAERLSMAMDGLHSSLTGTWAHPSGGKSSFRFHAVGSL